MTINRDADQRGFRLQKLRAVKKILELTNDPEVTRVYVANEAGADVSAYRSTKTTSENTNEEDKNYQSKFSLNSYEVLNSLVIFVDTWLQNQRSTKTRFLFYTSAGIAKENNTGTTRAAGIEFPSKPILELLTEGKVDDVAEVVSKALRAEYASQYQKMSNTESFKDMVKKLTVKEIGEFLLQIEWKFGEPNQAELEDKVEDAIRQSKFFDSSHLGKEEMIKNALTGMLEQKQCSFEYIDRFIVDSDVENTFLKTLSAQSAAQSDPAWKVFEIIDTSDYRSLSQKINGVDSSYPAKRINKLEMSVTLSKYEQNQTPDERGVKALKYSIYMACLPILEELDTKNVDVDKVLKELYSAAINHVSDRAKDFHFPLTNSQSIRQIVLDLFEDCFLSFDGDIENE